MKKAEEKLISRGLDGALDAAERARLDRLLAVDPDARDMNRVWEGMGDRLRAEAASTPVPDAAVAWQDIRRAIRQQEAGAEAAPAPGFPWRLRWAGAMAALVVVGLLGWSVFQLLKSTQPVMAAHDGSSGRVEWVVAAIPGAVTMIYTDTETDMTVIWMDVAQRTGRQDG